jgi:SAM-dependent methyltransferase
MKGSLGTYRIETFDDFRNVAQLYQYSRVILTALQLDLFTAAGSRSWTMKALAGRLRVNPRGLEILCRNLAALGLLLKNGRTYRNAPLSTTELNRKSPTYRAEYLDLIQSQWDGYAQLTASVRSGKPIEDDEPDSPKWRRRFTWAMHHRSREQAQQVARALDLKEARRLLDLGGGPGTYAMAFLSKNPSLRATIADRPAALRVAREIASTHPAKARLSYVPLDFMKDALPGSYDIVWLSNVIHIYCAEENIALFRKIATILRPGGLIIIQDSVLTGPQGLYPIDTTAFALVMLLYTATGNTYPAREIIQWLKHAGYSDVKILAGLRRRKDGENGLIQGRVKTRRRARRSLPEQFS